MAENWIIEQTVELTRPVQPYVGQPVELMLPGDHLAHTLRIKCKEKDMPVNLTGYTAAGYFKRTDGNTVLVVGSITGNTVDVTLSQECYAFAGNLRGVVRITNSTTDAKITLCDRLFHVAQAVDDGGTIDPGEVIPSLDDLLAEIEAMEQATAAAEAAADAVPDMVAPVFSTSTAYSAGSYIYYEGALYRFTADHAAGAWNSAQAVAVTVGGEVADLKSAMGDIASPVFIAIDVDWVRTDKYINTSGDVIDQAWRYQFEISVSAGETYKITGTNNWYKAIYATLDSNGDPVRYPATGTSGTVSDIIVAIEANETKLILQSNADDRSIYSISKYNGYVLNDEIIEPRNLSDRVAEMLPSFELINLFNPNDTDIVYNKYVIQGQFYDTQATNVSGFIPVELNAEYYFPFYASVFGTNAYICYYSRTKEYIGVIVGTYDATTKLCKIKPTDTNAAYVRVNFASAYSQSGDSLILSGGNFMFCKGAYPSHFIPFGEIGYIENGIRFSDAEQQKLNPLYRKKVVFAGDSICNGASANDNLNGWAGRIGLKNEMTWRNAGISGATLTAGLTGSYGVISATNFEDADYMIIEGGTNDADIIGNALSTHPAAFGTYDIGDYTSEFTNDTYCGAIEYMFKRLVSNHTGSKIGVIIAPKMGLTNATYTDYTAEHNNRRYYFETLIKLCEKWGVPYLNLWDECYLNPMIPAQYTSGENYMYVDGQHLTGNGYDYITPIIEAWMKTL